MYFKAKLIIIFLLMLVGYGIFFRPQDISFKTKESEYIVGLVLNKFKISASDVLKETHEFKKARRYRFEAVSKIYGVNADFPFDAFREEIDKQLSRKRMHVLVWEKNKKEKIARIDIGFRDCKIYTLFFRFIRKEAEKKEFIFKKAKVAIVIDDFGYGLNHIDSWVKFERPITFSILPNLAYSTKIANLANLNGKEIILHLPLEPQHGETEPREQFTVTTVMPKNDVIKILDRAVKTVPYLKGISNHQGSKATEDNNLMGIIFKYLNQKNLFFLDSLVTNKSVCLELAHQMSLRFAQRDIFLDNVNETEYIISQLSKLADVAQAKGFAIGIGHDRVKTLEALQSSYRDLESRGIEFVYLSTLVK